MQEPGVLISDAAAALLKRAADHVRIPGRMSGACGHLTFVPVFPCHVQPL